MSEFSFSSPPLILWDSRNYWGGIKIIIREKSQDAWRPKNVNFETWGLNCKLDGLGGIDVVFFVPSLLCDDNYNYNWLGPGLIQSGLELFLWSLQRSRDIQIELRHPRQNTRGSRRWWADPLPGTTRTRARCQHTRGQEMVALQRNLSTFKWLLRGQRNQWSDGKSGGECKRNIVWKGVVPTWVMPSLFISHSRHLLGDTQLSGGH